MNGIGVGVDVGGTFTDLVAIAPDGGVTARKVLTTPSDQSVAVAEALAAFDANAVDRIVHGTTVATNALLERKGARVVLCATRGFTDVIALRRQDRASLYDLSVHHPSPLVPRELIVDVDERINMAEKVGNHRTSMLQDVEAGRPTELDSLLGVVIELAQMVEIPTPSLNLVYDLTKFRSKT